MADFIREKLGLTQERVAAWLGTSRAAVSMAEAGQRGLPTRHGIQSARLTLAALGKVLAMAGEPTPAPPPLPTPVPEREPPAWRLRECQHQLRQLRRQLAAMQAQAAQLENRLTALPALRAYAGPIKNPAREAGWLALFEGEAVDGLRDDCGTGPQKLLEARIAGLAREAELLEELLAALPLAP